MTLAELGIALGFNIKEQDVDKVNNTISGIKNTATRLLGAIGVGFSLVSINTMVEEFTRVNNQIKSATDGLGEQREIQDDIAAAAEATRTSYSMAANTISLLVKGNRDLFSTVDEATDFYNSATMLFKSAGKTNEDIASLMEAMNQSFVRGYIDSETISQLLERSPEAVELLNKRLGTTSSQLEDLATNGGITVEDLKSIFVDNADEIEKSFDSVQYSITDALTVIQNKWGLWLTQTNETVSLTNKIGRFMVSAFNNVIGVLNRVRNGVVWLSDRLGGMDNMLRLIVMTGSALFAILNFSKITSGLSAISKLLTGINAKTVLLFAALLTVVLLVDDFINFMQGNNSLLGTLLERAGVDVDEFRENIVHTFRNVQKVIEGIANGIGNIVIPLFDAIKNVAKSALGTIGGAIESVAPDLANLLESLANGEVNTEQWEMIGEAIANVALVIAGCVAGAKAAKGIVGIVDSVGKGISVLQKIFTSVIPVAKILTTTVKGVGAVMTFLTSPVGFVVLAIAGLIAIIVMLITHWDQVKEAAALAVDMIRSVWGDIADWFNSTIVQPIIQFFTNLWNAITTTVGNIKNSIVEGFQSAIDWITSLPEQAVKWGSDIIDSIVQGITGTVGKIGEAASGIAGTIKGFLGFSEPDEGPLSDFHTYMPDMIDLMVQGIQAGKNQIRDAAESLAGDVSVGINADPSGASNVLNFLTNGIQNAKSLARSLFADLSGNLSIDVNAGLSNLSRASGVISNVVQSGMNSLRQLADGVVRDMATMARSATVSPHTAATAVGSNQINRTVVLNSNINNTFNGERAAQQRMAGAAKQSARDVTSELARGLAYAR